jgi:outer membrane protein insertion porin family
MRNRLAPLLVAAALFACRSGAEDLEGKTLRAIRLVGLERTRENVVRRELVSREGEPFHRSNLDRDAERLDRLRIFSSIELRALPDGNDGVDVEIALKETFPFLPTLSVEVKDENGLSLGPGLQSTNLQGKGIQLVTSARFGGATNLYLYLRDPWIAGNHVSYQLQVSRLDRPNPFYDFHELTDSFDLRLGSYWGQAGRFGARFSFLGVSSDRGGVTLSASGHDSIPSLGGFLGFDDLDRPSSPHRGSFGEIQLIHSGSFLGGSGRYSTLVLDGRRYQPLGDRHTLALSSLTTLQSGTVGVEIPIYQDFHLGGANTIRGWELDSVSGKNQMIHTGEYRFTAVKRRPFRVGFFQAYAGLRLVAFAETGVAWSDGHELARDRFLSGYGIGLHLLLPYVDVVRFELAFGQPGQGASLTVAIRSKVDVQRERVR